MRFLLAASVLVGLALSLPVPDLRDSLPTTPESLGEILFSDPILSRDSTVSCASCHRPAFAFADTTAFSVGITGELTRRNTPSVMNMLDRSVFMWDGRAATLQDQALLPLEHPHEMGFHRDSIVLRLRQNRYFAEAFQQVFNREPDLQGMLDALAAFQESLETADTPNDRWLFDKEPGLTAVQIRGRDLFLDKANCIECHFTPDFTADEFRNIGLFNGQDLNDPGRYEQTRDSADLGRFKVPGLRNVAVTAPYMHNGMFRTLSEVIRYYNDPREFLERAINPDPEIKPLGLTDTEMYELEQFLIGLTDDRFLHLLKLD